LQKVLQSELSAHSASESNLKEAIKQKSETERILTDHFQYSHPNALQTFHEDNNNMLKALMEKEKTASKDDNKDATSVQVMAQKVQKKA